jgi:hypothetical protein
MKQQTIQNTYGTFKATDKGWEKVPEKTIRVMINGKWTRVSPDNPMYKVVDTYASVKEYEEINGKI